jgi:hypothetical protein
MNGFALGIGRRRGATGRQRGDGRASLSSGRDDDAAAQPADSTTVSVRTPIDAPGVAPAAVAPHGVGLASVALLRVLSGRPAC